jgi:hypothetical protein
MMMLTILLTIIVGALSGAVGGLAIWWLLQQRHVKRLPLHQPAIGRDVEERISQAASQWAAAHGRPAAAPLLARKLRLAYVLNQRRRRRWSR